MNKIIKILIAIIILIALLIGGAYYYSTRSKQEVKLPEFVTLLPAKDAQIGKDINLSLKLNLPLYRKVLNAVVTVEGNLIALKNPKIKVIETQLLERTWKITATMRANSLGKTTPGVMAIELSDSYSDNDKTFYTIPIPSIDIVRYKDANNFIALADKFEANSEKITPLKLSLIILGSIILIAFVVAIIFHFRKKVSIIPPWDVAISELNELRDNVHSNKIPVEKGIFLLTNLVRDYLDVRFNIPISSQTTNEFIENSKYLENILPAEQLPFLKEFLSTADKIKFALSPVDKTMFDDAAKHAEELIEETEIKENKEGKDV